MSWVPREKRAISMASKTIAVRMWGDPPTQGHRREGVDDEAVVDETISGQQEGQVGDRHRVWGPWR